MAVRRAAPFSDPEYDVAWMGDVAAIWYWSRQRALAVAGTRGARDRFRAEALYLDQPREDGAVLLALPSGVEGRCWRGGELVASRWWPTPPDTRQWQLFLRGAGIEADAHPLPAPEPAVHHAQPWTGTGHRGEALGHLLPHAPTAAAAVGLLLLAAFAWQLGSGLRAMARLHAVQAELGALEADLERILTAREQAEADRREIDALLALRPPAPQYRMLAEAARLMTGTDWRIALWSQPNPDVLEVTFSLPNPDSQRIVAAWEDSPLFADVSPSLARQGDGMTLRMRVLRQDGRVR